MTIFFAALAFFAGAATAAWITSAEECDDCALADARIEDLENELRWHTRPRHPTAGRGLAAVTDGERTYYDGRGFLRVVSDEDDAS